jgi:hypothetical protein
LGDFTGDAQVDTAGSSGVVNSSDLTLFSARYFASVPSVPAYYDIGPENAENGIGRGIPSPDGQINFADLVPFSLNFGTTGPASFLVRPRVDVPKHMLDDPPLIRVMRGDSIPIGVGGEFTVQVALQGDAIPFVRAVEAALCYDADVLDFVSSRTVTPGVDDGDPFAVTKLLPGEVGTVGIAAAALGESARLHGEGVIGRLTFVWKDRRTASTRLTLHEVKAADVNGSDIGVSAQDLELNAVNVIPVQFALYQNFPNPFNPSTRIRFDLPEDGPVRIDIYNCMGQRVATLIDEPRQAGAYTVMWNGRNDSGLELAAGVYLFRIEAGRFSDTKKMVLLK